MNDNRYSKLKVINNQGGFSESIGCDNESSERVLIKELYFSQIDDGIGTSVIREVTQFKSLVHPNIVRLLDVSRHDDYMRIVYEFMDLSLGRYIKPKIRNQMSENEANLIRSYSYQILCGLAFMHSQRVIHRNINPNTLLVNRTGYIKISDFAYSRVFPVPIPKLTPIVHDIWYISPECLFGGEDYDLSADIWSAGCVIAEMSTGSPIFRGDCILDQAIKIFKVFPDNNYLLSNIGYDNAESVLNGDQQKLGDLINSNDPLFLDLLTKLLNPNPDERISAIEALRHPYFDTIPQVLVDTCLPILKS